MKDNIIIPSQSNYVQLLILIFIIKGTKKENDDVLPFQNVGLSSAISLSNLSLFSGTSYYFSVKGISKTSFIVT